MTEAPKRIWITKLADGSMSIAWYSGKPRGPSIGIVGMEDIHYVQTDIADQMLAEIKDDIPYVQTDIADQMLAALKFARPFMAVANLDSSQDLIGPIDAAIAKAEENDQ